MSQPYVGEVRLVGFNFNPQDWALCNGQLLSIAEYQTLYALIGTTYGGDGVNTFALPDLRGRIPIHQGNEYVMGQIGGSESVTLTTNSYPAHNHQVSFSATSSNPVSNPAGNTVVGGPSIYTSQTPDQAMNSATLSNAPGSGLPHNNLQPYVALNWIIALYGVYPTQN